MSHGGWLISHRLGQDLFHICPKGFIQEDWSTGIYVVLSTALSWMDPCCRLGP